MCNVLLPPAVNPLAVNKYININIFPYLPFRKNCPYAFIAGIRQDKFATIFGIYQIWRRNQFAFETPKCLLLLISTCLSSILFLKACGGEKLFAEPWDEAPIINR
jgi:hypothetical protein